ncbi:MAG TPA: MBL fold metallo-hydrolase [Gemmatimonadaceae bacterium]|nr:MBL fold metallo-hydrolase [Gemmatimonadaceae bacterium]
MRRRLSWLVAFLLCAAPSVAAAQGRGPRAIVVRAVEAMGGEQAVRGIASTVVEFNQATFALGQEETPESPARAGLASGRITIDHRGGRRAVSQEVRPAAGNPSRQRSIVVGDAGMLEMADGRLVPAAPGLVTQTQRTMRMQPERLVLTALDSASSLRALPSRQWRGEIMDGVRLTGRDTVSLYFDRRSGLLTVSEVVSDDPILGDRRTVTWYTRWQNAGPVKLPRQVDVEVNGRLQVHSTIQNATVNGPLDDSTFAIPDSITARAQPLPSGPPSVVVQLVELAPDVWRAEGGSHHSLVVEQANQLVVVEAPLNSVRSRAVLDTLRSRFPSKRVGMVVSTHHHWDHSGGIREYLASGIPVVAHARNAAFIRRIGAARKTVAPDALTRRPRQVVVRSVNDSLTVGEGDGRLVLYNLPSAHAEGILAAYHPRSRLLFTSDVLSPGTTLAPVGSAELVALVRSLGITVDRFAGGHGGVAPWAEVDRAAAAPR